MMLTSFPFVMSALPPIVIGEPLEMSFREFVTLLEENCNAYQRQPMRVIRRLVDLNNIIAFWKGEPLDPHGNFTEVEMEEQIGLTENFQPYVLEFLERYPQREDQIRMHGYLISQYFNKEIAKAHGFLKRYLTFEREWRLVMIGFRSKETGRDVALELQWEEPTDVFVAQILLQKDSAIFEPPDGYEDLKVIMEQYKGEPRELDRALELYRFRRVEEMSEKSLFASDNVLCYLVQIMIAERMETIDERSSKRASA